MLGIPLSAPGGDLSKWFIPTYVGHTTPWRSFCPARPVHPHLRGAYPYKKSADFTAYGSSPHTWGIPAVRAFMAPAFPVLPHIRGAYVLGEYISTVGLGSSPHTWGIQIVGKPMISSVRFIPTYVGHTSLTDAQVKKKTVHPHIRGAYAKLMPASAAPTVHPHIRGAYNLCNYLALGQIGSSPHTWGIPVHSSVLAMYTRFIPTYVGHTFKRTENDHCRRGSSPHTWGIHWTAVRKMAGFSHFSYDFTRKSYFVQGLVFFGVIGAEAFPTHRRGRNQCLPGAHGGSVRNL